MLPIYLQSDAHAFYCCCCCSRQLEMRQNYTHSLLKYIGTSQTCTFIPIINLKFYAAHQIRLPIIFSWVLVVFVWELGPTLPPVHSVASRDESSRRQRLLAFGKLEATTATELPTP